MAWVFVCRVLGFGVGLIGVVLIAFGVWWFACLECGWLLSLLLVRLVYYCWVCVLRCLFYCWLTVKLFGWFGFYLVVTVQFRFLFGLGLWLYLWGFGLLLVVAGFGLSFGVDAQVCIVIILI